MLDAGTCLHQHHSAPPTSFSSVSKFLLIGVEHCEQADIAICAYHRASPVDLEAIIFAVGVGGLHSRQV
jgi:hypothetical protein